MARDRVTELREFAARYTAAWCSGDAASVAAFFAPGGSLTINGGAPAVGRGAIAEAAQGFMTAFPDLEVHMDDLLEQPGKVIYTWTLAGTNTGPGGTGKRVRISGFEEWRMGDDGLVAGSLGHFDAAEYQRQVEHGVDGYRSPSDIYPSLTYDDAPSAIAWLCRAFGFTKRFVVAGPDNRVEHSELSYGTGVVMVNSPKPADRLVSPKALAGTAQSLSVFVADPDAHHQLAVASGARVVRELRTEEYGARGYMALDPEGHLWYFGNYRPGTYWAS